MNVNGPIWVFPKEVGKDKIKIFETSINRKEEGGYVDTLTLRVNFSKSLMNDEQKKTFSTEKAYKIEIEGFLTTRSYDDKNGNRRIEPVIQVTKAKMLEKKEVQRKEKAEKPVESPLSGD